MTDPPAPIPPLPPTISTPVPPPVISHPPTSRAALPPIPAPGTLAVDPRVFACELPCIHCAYDLRTIHLSARCPECGKPAADSLHALALVEPADLARTRLALILLIIAGIGIPLLVVLIALATVFVGNSGSGEGAIAFFVGVLILGAGPVISLIACSQIARPVRRQHIHDLPTRSPDPGTGPALQTFATAFLLLCTALGLVILIVTNSHGPTEGVVVAGATFGCLALIAWDVRNFLLCRTFAALCSRANLPGTRRMFNFLFGAAICFAAAHATAGTIALLLYLQPRSIEDLFGNPSGTGPRGGIFQFIFILVGIATSVIQFASLGWAIAWPIMLALLHRRLTRPLALARAAQRDILTEPSTPDAAFFSPAPPQHPLPHIPFPPS